MTDRYDDIVIGAGSSGAALAARLSEDPSRRVLLLEGGPDYTGDDVPAPVRDGSAPVMTGYNWGYKATAGLTGRTLDYLRGKLTGGSSAINTCIALRGAPADFGEWVAAGLTDWSFDDVLPYYLRLEDDPEGDPAYHHTGGPIAIRRAPFGELRRVQTAFRSACESAGYKSVEDLNSPELDPQGTVGPLPMDIYDGVRQSTNLTYLAAARGRPNLTILGDRLVDKVRIENGRAVGVDVVHQGRDERYDAGRITISAGAISTPLVLVRSGIGPRALLHELGIPAVSVLEGVGANLMDHPTSAFVLKPIRGLCKSSDPAVQLMLRYTAAGSPHVNDIQVYMMSQFDTGGWGPDTGDPNDRLAPMINPCVQKPYSRGTVRASSSAADADPIIDMNFLADDFDRARMREGMRICAGLIRTGPMNDIIDDVLGFPIDSVGDDQALDDYLDATVAPIFHASGTARMGRADDEGAVVDGRFRVRGVDGLRVVDASVLPTIVRANTNLTCMMLGERAADFYNSGE
jgi:choline dehydrogenase